MEPAAITFLTPEVTPTRAISAASIQQYVRPPLSHCAPPSPAAAAAAAAVAAAAAAAVAAAAAAVGPALTSSAGGAAAAYSMCIVCLTCVKMCSTGCSSA